MYDPREKIRDTLKAYIPAGQERKGIVFHDDRGDEHPVDIHLWEAKVNSFEEGGKLGLENPQMVLLSLVSSTSKNLDIGGGCRNHIGLIDAHIFLVKDERWSAETIKQEVSSNIENCIRASQKTVTGCNFVECINGRDLDPLKQSLGVRRIIGIRATGDCS